MAAEPFLSPGRKGTSKRCFVCWTLVSKNQKLTSIKSDGLSKFQEQAIAWSQIQNH